MKADMKDAQGDKQRTPEQRNARQKQREARLFADVDSVQLLQMPPDQRYNNILKMSPEERVALARSMKGPEGMQLVDGMKPEQRETIQAIMAQIGRAHV